MKRLLIQTQLSNYDTSGKFILECDSGFQMVMGRVREMLKLNLELHVDVMCPYVDLDGQRQVVTDPWDVNPDLWKEHGPDGSSRLRFIEHWIIPNALVTRYDFDWTSLACSLDLGMQKIGRAPKWDVVYVNDPMHLRNFKAMFHVVGGYQPKFFVHSHFVDNPECPKFPTEASLWLGQCEAALRADFNFWQCESAMNVFFGSMSKMYRGEAVDAVRARSAPWDDGYSAAEITSLMNLDNLRFNVADFHHNVIGDKTVIFVPNRIGGKGRSSDYTNCGKFMFELLPQLRKKRQDFVVVAGNPSQKFSNDELARECGPSGYVKLVPDALNRDEFKYVAHHSDIVLGLYDQDAYGGTAARECIELGCMPLWLDNFEYSSLAREAKAGDLVLARTDFSDLGDKLSALFDLQTDRGSVHPNNFDNALHDLQKTVRNRCSYEATTPRAMQLMGLL